MFTRMRGNAFLTAVTAIGTRLVAEVLRWVPTQLAFPPAPRAKQYNGDAIFALAALTASASASLTLAHPLR
jgi:hypothetical protein